MVGRVLKTCNWGVEVWNNFSSALIEDYVLDLRTCGQLLHPRPRDFQIMYGFNPYQSDGIFLKDIVRGHCHCVFHVLR